MTDHQAVIDQLPDRYQDPIAAYLGSVRDAQQEHYRQHGRYVPRCRVNSAPGGPDGWKEPLTVAVDVAGYLRVWHWLDTYGSGVDGFIVRFEIENRLYSFDFGHLGQTGIVPIEIEEVTE